MLGTSGSATALHSLELDTSADGSTHMSSAFLPFTSTPAQLVSALSRCCGLSPKLVSDVSLLSASVLPAVVTLCIVRVPNLSSRLRRLPFVALCMMLLLWAAMSSRAPQAAGGFSSNEDMLSSSSSSSSSSAGVQLPTSYSAGPSSKSIGSLSSMTVAAAPILMALFLVQPRGRRSQAGVGAVLGLSLVLQLAAVDAAASVCASVKPVCTAPQPIVMGSSAPKPAAVAVKSPAAIAASALVKSPAPVPPTSSSSSSANPYAETLLAAMGVRKEAFHVASLREPDSDVPQRVMPLTPHPRLSKALEQQLFTQLLVALNSNSSRSSAGAAVPSAPRSPAPAPAPASPAQADPADGLLYLSNARLKVGVDPARGGAITHLSSPVMPPEWAGRNLINTWDSGRLIQQSYYGCEDGSCWSTRAWRWNPVQGGSWHNAAPKLLASSQFGDMLSTSALPRNWGGQGLLDDVVMTTQSRLLPNMVKVRQTMRYTGNAGHPERHQEVPAVFVDRRLNALAIYSGSAPWTGGQLSFLMPGQVNEYFKTPEKWAAYVDTKSGFGVGVYTPVAEQLVAYRVGGENSSARSDCSYFAPLVTAAIQPQSEFSYDTYIAVGRVDEMRQWFAALAAATEPALAVQRRIALPATVDPSALRMPAAAAAAQSAAAAAPAPLSFAQALSPRNDSFRLMVDTTGLQGSSRAGAQLLPVKPVAVGAGLLQPALLAPMAVQPTPKAAVKVTTG
ncbi:hypothetical protein OEZ85_008276 [Tetradesmus obliquus]|uniref:Uncharacterized protein n=1 Tax=Tetradesmus obliquus TaxID=3088 RepID=A0ABY8TIP7_TETOB|nr:hypothetical protein OEZ85_008276 [Tetradesmus obliquus]